MNDRLDRVRFGPERDLIALLFERYGLDDVLRRFVESGEAGPFYELTTTTQLRLTPLLAPRLTDLLRQAQETLGFEEPTDLYVHASAEINAFALHSQDDRPHVISVTSGLVERMSDAEIGFVMGHELGHLRYGHYRSRLVQLALLRGGDEDSRLPPLLERRLQTWDRMAELSADRAGFAAIGDLTATISAFFKMETGLGPEHLRYDIDAFLAQLEDIQKLTRRDVLAQFSHPVTPVRVRSVQLFHLAGGIDAEEDALRTADDAVAEVARLMELEVTEPMEVHLRDLLISGTLLATHTGGTRMRPEQSQLLLEALLPLTADPEQAVQAVASPKVAREMLDASAGWLSENAGEQRYAALAQIAHIAALDGALPEPEEDFILSLAKKLQIPEKRAKELIYEAVTAYLQQQATTKTPVYELEES